MSRPRSVPKYRLHKPSGRAVVTLPTPGGGRRDVYLGQYDSPESRREYARVIAEWSADPSPRPPGGGLSVAELILAFLRHAADHYRRADGTATNEVREYEYTLDPLDELYGATPAADFGPLALRAVRERMVGLGWARTTVNNRVRRLRHVFRWAAGLELVPASVPQALACVGGLQRGRTAAREPDPVRPVESSVVDETLPYLSETVRAMVEVQRLCGCRPQDVCGLRPADIDTSGDVWLYRPPQHKNAHRGAERVVPIGPRARAVLERFAPDVPEAYYFSPARQADADRARKKPGRPHAERCYKSASYALAVTRAVERANAAPRRNSDFGPALPPVEHWSPGQLRHARATEVRERYGLEAAQVVLGHAKADTTQLYARRNLDLAVRVAREIG